MSYSENKPCSWRSCVLSDQNFFKESKRDPPKENSCQIIMQSIEPCGEEDFLKFHNISYSENKARPRRPCFFVVLKYLQGI